MAGVCRLRSVHETKVHKRPVSMPHLFETTLKKAGAVVSVHCSWCWKKQT